MPFDLLGIANIFSLVFVHLLRFLYRFQTPHNIKMKRYVYHLEAVDPFRPFPSHKMVKNGSDLNYNNNYLDIYTNFLCIYRSSCLENQFGISDVD